MRERSGGWLQIFNSLCVRFWLRHSFSALVTPFCIRGSAHSPPSVVSGSHLIALYDSVTLLHCLSLFLPVTLIIINITNYIPQHHHHSCTSTFPNLATDVIIINRKHVQSVWDWGTTQAIYQEDLLKEHLPSIYIAKNSKQTFKKQHFLIPSHYEAWIDSNNRSIRIACTSSAWVAWLSKYLRIGWSRRIISLPWTLK